MCVSQPKPLLISGLLGLKLDLLLLEESILYYSYGFSDLTESTPTLGASHLNPAALGGLPSRGLCFCSVNWGFPRQSRAQTARQSRNTVIRRFLRRELSRAAGCWILPKLVVVRS